MMTHELIRDDVRIVCGECGKPCNLTPSPEGIVTDCCNSRKWRRKGAR